MSKTVKTYEDVIVLANALNFLSKLESEKEKNNKGIKKLEKIIGKIKPNIEKYNESLEDIRLDCANTDDNGSVLMDEKGGYKFSKDGMKELKKKVSELLKQEVEIERINLSPEGLENYQFLDGWVDGLEFKKEVNVDDTQIIEMNAE